MIGQTFKTPNEAIMTAFDLSTGDGVIKFSIEPPLRMYPGQKYAIAIEAPDAPQICMVAGPAKLSRRSRRRWRWKPFRLITLRVGRKVEQGEGEGRQT